MVLSRYNFFVDVGDGVVVYNSFSGAIIRLERQTYDLLIKEDYETLSADYYDTLRENGIIVEFDELEYIRKTREKIAEKDEKFALTILTTTKCNARCFYCYEHGVEKKDMDQDVAVALINYIKENIGQRKLHITWFGGEPLVNKKVIDYISSTLTSLKIDFSASMVTNGLLVTSVNSDDIKKWHLTKAQITLDGIGEEYNRIKNYSCYYASAFEVVISNIEWMLSNNIFVTIRINFDPKEISNAINTIEYIYSKFGNNKYLRVYAANINDDKVILPNEQSEEENAYLHIYKKLIDCDYVNGLPDLQLKAKMIYCGNVHKSFLVVNPDGSFYKCEHAVNREEEVVGNVFSSDIDISKVHKWAETEYPYSECYICNCLPVCQGGCKALLLYNGRRSNCLQIKSVIPKIIEYYYDWWKKKTIGTKSEC
mgnify:CR=1 FL=1